MLKKLLLSLGLLACSIAGAQDVPIVIIKDKPVAVPGTPVLKQWWRQAVTNAQVIQLQQAPAGVSSTNTRTGVNGNPQPNALVITPCPSGQVESGGLCVCPAGSSWNAVANSCDGPPTCDSTSISSVWNANATQLQTTIGGVSGLTTSVLIPSWGTINGQNDIVWLPATNLGGGTWRGSFDATVVNEPGQYNAHVYLYSTAYPGPPGTFCAAAVTNRPVSCVAASSCPPATAWNGSQCTGNFTNCAGNPTSAQGYTWYNLNSAFVGSATCPQTGTGVIAATCGACPATQSWNGASCVCIAPLVWNGATCACPSGTMFNAGANTCDGPPTIPTLTASLASMCAGQGNVFAWTTAGANAASIACTNGLNVGAGLNSSTTQVFNTSGTNSCTITAVNTGTGQGVTRAVSFTVNTVPAQGTVTVNPSVVTSGTNANWIWNLAAGTGYRLNCPTAGAVGPVAQTGNIAWGAGFPTGTHNCQFISDNACGSSTPAVGTLSVNACPPITFPITVNGAASANVTAGAALSWDWNASGGTGLTNTVTWSGAFAGTGQTGITAVGYAWGSAGWPNGVTNFSFTATNSCGSTATKVVQVTINACPAVTGTASVSPANLNSNQTAYWTWGFTGGTIASVTRTCFSATTVPSTAMPLTGSNVPFGASGLALGTTYCYFAATNTCGQSATTANVAVTVTNPVSPCPINCITATNASDAVWNAGAQTCDHPNTTCPAGKTLVPGGAGLNYWTVNTAAPGPSACPVSSGELTKTLPNCIVPPFQCQDGSSQASAAACPTCPDGSQVAPWGLCVTRILTNCGVFTGATVNLAGGNIAWTYSSALANCTTTPFWSQNFAQSVRNGVSYWSVSGPPTNSGSSFPLGPQPRPNPTTRATSCANLADCAPISF